MPAHAQAQGHGPARWLDERTAAEFKAELDKGRWRRAQDARRWLENKLGRRLTLIVTYKYLGKCEARLNVPRPTHRKKDPAKVEAFRAELCEKLHGDGAEFLHTDGVSLEASRCFLEQVGRSAPEAMHLVIQDGAGFHQDEGAAELPANVRVIHLPPYSPELNPVERLWDVVKDRICNQVWKDLDELMAAINGVLTDYWTTPAKVRAPVGEGWLLDTANASYPSVLAAWMDNSCEMLRPGEVGRDGAEVAANQRPLRKAPARGWGGFLTTDFTDDTDGLQGRNAFIRAIRVIRGSFFAPSAEFCRGFNQAVPCSRKNWRWECGRHLGVRWQSEARAATPPWRPRCGRRCPCIRLKSPPKAAWRLRFPPHSKAPPVFPRASSLFSRDSISRILTATSRRHPAPRWKRACGTCLRSLSRRGCRPCRARNEVSRPTHLCRHWRQCGDGRADEMLRPGEVAGSRSIRSDTDPRARRAEQKTSCSLAAELEHSCAVLFPLGMSKDSLERLKAEAEQGDADAQFNLGEMYSTDEGIPNNKAEAVRWYRKAAEQGHAAAQSELALRYCCGEGVRKDAAEAVNWYRKAAEQGHAEAQGSLGVMYAEGKGVPKNAIEAAKWYRKAAEQGDECAQSLLGGMYARGEGVLKDPIKAVKWLSKAAEHGDADSQRDLGWRFAEGLGVPKDAKEAVRWYRKAAEKGNARAQSNLGWMYKYGEGVPEDFVEAAKWFLKAAKQGDEGAQFYLGLMYRDGEGLPKDSTEAFKWLLKAAEQGSYTSAQFYLGEMYAKGEGVPKNSTEAVKWLRKAAERGNSSAQFSLGEMYAKGEGVSKDSIEAVKWLRKAAESGCVETQCILGEMYAKGDGIPRDSTEALKWFRKASESGYEEAQCILGGMYAKGEGVPKDGTEAMRWYRKAAEQGHVGAQCILGEMYAKGEGVPKDDEEAVKWYHKAAEQGHAEAQFGLGLMYQDGEGVAKDSVSAYKYLNLAAVTVAKAANVRNELAKSMAREHIAEAQRLSREWKPTPVQAK